MVAGLSTVARWIWGGLEWDSRRGYEFQEKQNRPNLCLANKSAE